MIPFIGLASGLGAGNEGCQKGPLFIQQHLPFPVEWKAMIHPEPPILEKMEHIAIVNRKLAHATYSSALHSPFTVIIGGDHSCAVGTWSGVAEAKRLQGKDIGLIWMDAHMDAHTPETSESGNIHGMPLASLLGIGSPHLTHIISENPKLKPENVFVIGIRDYEEPEKRLLEDLDVRIYFMDEVYQRGLKAILSEAVQYFTQKEIPYGISLDIDFFDPMIMSATGTPVNNGMDPDEFIENYSIFDSVPPIAFEYVEFNPFKDVEDRSLKFSIKILEKSINSFIPNPLYTK